MTLAECRQIVGPDSALTDAELLALRDALQPLARLVVEGLREQRKAARQQPHLQLVEATQ